MQLRPARWTAAVLALLLAACTAGAPAGPASGAPVTGTGLPPIDSSCRVDADCQVKDVGNCCGYYPACVHRDAATDPAAVLEDCRRRGLASACGFRDIQACACVEQRCEPAATPLSGDLL